MKNVLKNFAVIAIAFSAGAVQADVLKWNCQYIKPSDEKAVLNLDTVCGGEVKAKLHAAGCELSTGVRAEWREYQATDSATSKTVTVRAWTFEYDSSCLAPMTVDTDHPELNFDYCLENEIKQPITGLSSSQVQVAFTYRNVLDLGRGADFVCLP